MKFITRYVVKLVRQIVCRQLRGAHTERQRQHQRQRLIQVNGDAWEWVWDPFSSGTMHSNETLPLMLPLPLGLFTPLNRIPIYALKRNYFKEQ